MPPRTRKSSEHSDQPITVYPVFGYFLNGVPAVPTALATRKEAEALVATGAFSFDRPEPVTPEPSEADAPEPSAADEPPAAEEPAPSPEEA